MTTCDLHAKECAPCNGEGTVLEAEAARTLIENLHPDWVVSDTGTGLRRRLNFKGFAKAVYAANVAAFLADQEGHHPDVSFGWGYCEIVFTTHELGGVSENDFICAAKFDRMISG